MSVVEDPVLSDAELEGLLDSESDRVERKRSAADADKIHETICAFANDLPGHGAPGVLFVGLNPDGTCAGLTIDDELLLQLSALRDDGLILPLPSMVVQKRSLRGCDLAVIFVEPSRCLPVRYRGRVCVRVGPRRATASADEERQLIERQRAFNLPFDAREAPSATMTDLDVSYAHDEYLPTAIAPEVIAQNERPIEHQLRSIHFLGPTGTPTHVGLLVAGIDPLSWMPGAYIQFARFSGTELTDPIRDQKTVAGRLGDVLRRIDEILQAHNQVGISFTGGPVEQRQAEYPLPALQQLVRNAIMHRNYDGTNAPSRVYWFDDRIEIHSPGGPYGQVSRENFGQPYANDYRNPHVAEAMRTLGFVQRFGIGIATARRELARNGNPPVEFDVQAAAILATVRRRP
jgi:ATP-dependent DNA helicase RecG